MDHKALIFGSGKTGRGFAAHLAFLSGYEIVLIDNNIQLINELRNEGQYNIQVLGNEERSTAITFSKAYQIDDLSWHEELVSANVIFTAVFGNNLEELSSYLATAIIKRKARDPEKPLTIITCENLANAACFLKDCILKAMPEEQKAWLSQKVGFSEAIIFKTCLGAADGQHPLTIRAQNFFELPCDGDAIKEPLHIFGLKPLANFQNQLTRKIYTYNCINAVITYLGAKKGYLQLSEAGNDEETLQIANKAATETSAALIAEFGFDPEEQAEWVHSAFAKFSDQNTPDPIERNGADPVRKLNRTDRLIGPALLALKHGIYPHGLLVGITACFDYNDTNKKIKVADLVIEKGLDSVLKEVCGLGEGEELFTLIKQRFTDRSINGS